MARALTRMQASVIDSVLAGEPGTQRERIRRSGLAPRTYQVARRRALEAGWVAERFVPDPVLFGRPKVTMAIARTTDPLDRATGERWSRFDGSVLVWRTPRTLFGVFFTPQRSQGAEVVADLESSDRYGRHYSIEMDLGFPSLPVYFDFEAEWAQVCGIPGISYYPRPLPRRARSLGRTPLSERWRHVVEELVRRDANPDPVATTTPSLLQRISLRSAIPRALASGWVDQRAFLNPASLPSFEQWSLRQVVFVWGRLRAERRPEVLLRTLMVGCRVHPFLYVTNGSDLLLATMSPPPTLPADSDRRFSVSGTLARYLEHITVLREPTDDLEVLVNHRYDRILDGSGVGRGPPLSAVSTPIAV